MRNVSPLGALVAIVILGITIEVVERQSPKAAFALAVLLLLGMITFNAAEFRNQAAILLALFNAPGKRTPTQAAQATRSPTIRR